MKAISRNDGRHCIVASGRWTDTYSYGVYTDPSELDIDHVVPLQNAYLSGGWKWTSRSAKTTLTSLTTVSTC